MKRWQAAKRQRQRRATPEGRQRHAEAERQRRKRDSAQADRPERDDRLDGSRAPSLLPGKATVCGGRVTRQFGPPRSRNTRRPVRAAEFWANFPESEDFSGAATYGLDFPGPPSQTHGSAVKSESGMDWTFNGYESAIL